MVVNQEINHYSPNNSVNTPVNPRATVVQGLYNIDNAKENIDSRSSSIYSPNGESLCSYSPLQMSKRSNNNAQNAINQNNIVKPHSPSALCLSPLQRTPMQARKWRALAAEVEEKKKSNSKSGRKGKGKTRRKSGGGGISAGMMKVRTPLGKIRKN